MSNKRNIDQILESLLQPAGSTAEKLLELQCLRAEPALAARADTFILERLAHLQQALRMAEMKMGELGVLHDKLTAPPWYPALFIRLVETAKGPRALVREGATNRLVGVGDGIDPSSLAPCEEVYLNQNQNLILGRIAARPAWRSGESCSLRQKLSDGRLLVRCHGEELVVHAPSGLAKTINEGDEVLCDLATRVALEPLQQEMSSHLFLETSPRETFADIGGLDSQVTRIQEAITLHWKNPDLAGKYGLPRTGSILLFGPPGTGKTMLARAFANFLGTLVPSGQSLFMNIKPGELHSMWFAESEKNYRELFRVARQKATPQRPVVIFFDEIDAIGSSRGHSYLRVHDNVLTALIAELDGLAERGNVLVIAATNRRDALDPALVRPGRLGDLVLEVPRPNRAAAREIFRKHLTAGLPLVRTNHGEDGATKRAEIIESALSRIYAPNGESELAQITFRDGSRRSVRAPDLVSGAVIANICRQAKQKACRRELQTGMPGVAEEDLLLAVGEEFHSVAKNLTTGNCRQHMAGLPQDLDVVRVEPAALKKLHPLHFVQAA